LPGTQSPQTYLPYFLFYFYFNTEEGVLMSEDQTAPDVPNDDSTEATEATEATKANEVTEATEATEATETAETCGSSSDVCLDAITAEVDGLTGAMNFSRYSRVGLVVVVIAFVVYLTLDLKKFAESLTDEDFTHSLVEEAKGQYFGKGDPEELLQSESKKLGDTIVQTLQGALKEQLDNDLEEYKGIVSIERETLAKNMESRLNKIFNERYAEALNNHEKVLREKFPEFTDDQLANLLANLETAMNQVLLDHYQNEIKGSLNKLYKNYDEFPVAMPHQGEGTVEDAFFGSAATVGINMLKDIETGAANDTAPLPTPPPAPAAPAAEAPAEAAPAEKAEE
jgi:hypothetical protein